MDCFSEKGIIIRKQAFLTRERAESDKDEWAKEAIESQHRDGSLSALSRNPIDYKVCIVEIEVMDV